MKRYSLLYFGAHSGVIRDNLEQLPFCTTRDVLDGVDAARKTIETLGGSSLKFVGYIINRRAK